MNAKTLFRLQGDFWIVSVLQSTTILGMTLKDGVNTIAGRIYFLGAWE